MKHIKVPIRRLTTLSLTAVLTTAAVVGSPAHADEHQLTVAFTNGQGIHPRSSPSMAASEVGNVVPDGGTVSVVCETEGEAVSNGAANIFIWDKLTDGSFVPNAFLATDTNGRTPGVPACEDAPTKPKPSQSTARKQKYDRQVAVAWALANVDSKNRYDEDCTWFVSKALWAGGIPETDDWKYDDEFLRGNPPINARVADELKNYLVNETHHATIKELSWSQNDVPDAQVGDLIAYDLYGSSSDKPADGFVDHIAIITSFDGQYPRVTAHTNRVKDQGWTYSEYAKYGQGDWVENQYKGSRAYLIHITY